MSTKTEHTDDEYLEAISQGVMAVPGTSGQGHSAMEVAASVLKWLRQRGMVPKPSPKEVVAHTLRFYAGRTTAAKINEVEAVNMAAQITGALYNAGYRIEG